jgi:hypothetical protein
MELFAVTATVNCNQHHNEEKIKHERNVAPTRYGLDGPGIESLWRRDFPHPFRPALGPTQPPIQWVPGLSRG